LVGPEHGVFVPDAEALCDGFALDVAGEGPYPAAGAEVVA
jgi:hypothetical protein